MTLEKTYSPSHYESTMYKLWEESGSFAPTGKGEPFSIIMPPPNANGSLHAGHLMFVVEDILTRYARMNGRPALWLPGTDHAGIETQFVYEKRLAAEGKDRFDLGPDEFYRQVMGFTKSSQATILNQFRAMGFSADWSKLKFTLDEDIISIVYDTFARLHKEGHIYRGNRIVNWCVRCQAAFADIELERKSEETELYTLDYGSLQISTVRPETIFADVAIAVHPEDERYAPLIGTDAAIPLHNRPIPIIADTHVDPSFGTGALKVTPGHDMADYEIGLRHSLPEISVIDRDGVMINVPDEFAGLSVSEARVKTVAALESAGKLISRERYSHNVSIHDRCGSIVEPLISEQWFLRIKELNRPVIEAIENDDIIFHPKRFKSIALDWLKQERDWCISRQIWWGIRIPVFYKTSHDPDKDPYLVAKSEEEAIAYYGEGNYRAETDTFDTWFSSGQWPYATLKTTDQFDKFYPTSVMGTARDILHKWVTRMIMFGLYQTGEVPFRHVYLWGIVTDEKGDKLSKSKGNYVDPMETTATYGTDALRLALASSNTPGSNSPLAERQVEAMRNFNNKLWNVARFILDKAGEDYKPEAPKPVTLADRWIENRLQQGVQTITRLINEYRFNEATQHIYHLLWDDFADWYLEASKVEENINLLVSGLETILKLLHPFAPFVTETIWQQLPWRDDLLITAAWPHSSDKLDESALRDFQELQTLISEIRTIGNDISLQETTLYHRNEQLLSENAELVAKLAGLKASEHVSDGRGLPIPNTKLICWLDVDEGTLDNYRQTLNARLEELQASVARLNARLANKAYTRNAPKEVVNDTKQQLKDATGRAEALTSQLKDLDGE